MKARFNYDLSEVRELLSLSQAIQEAQPETRQLQTEVLQAADRESDRQRDRQALIDRVDTLTQLMSVEREKARAAQSNLNLVRALDLLKSN